MEKQIEEIQNAFEKSLHTWADLILNFEIKIDEAKILPKKYPDKAIMDVTILFRHVLFNLGYYQGLLNKDNAEQLGKELHELIKKYCGVNTKTFFQSPKENLN